MNTPILILASASPRRAELLRQLGLEFQIVPPDLPEVPGGQLSAGEVAQINAYRKARAVSKKFPDALTLGVDTVVALGNALFGKPATLAEAEKMLLTLQGKTHLVVTGVCLIHLRAHRQLLFSEQTEVTFRPLTLAQIRRYHAQVNPLDKAGAYGIQEKGDVLVASISGSFSNVIGLPLERLEAALAAFTAPSPPP
ncbi:MAG: Maf family protein [Verrucomicrobiota bacterium]